MNNFIVQVLIATMASFVLVLLLVPAIIQVCRQWNLADQPNERKVHKAPTARLGGVAIFAGALGGLLLNRLGWQALAQWPILFSSVCILFITGVWDDLKNISIKLRFLVQIFCSLALAASGLRLTSLYGICGIHDIAPLWQYIVTTLIIVGTTNAFNLIDGVDGLAGGLALISMPVLAWLAWQLQLFSLVVLLAGLTGALAGFLRYNKSPARIFMGDGGSLVLGYLMSTIGVLLIEKARIAPHLIQPSRVAILVTALLVIPVFDTIRVFGHRIRSGRSPFSADKNHIHHLLLVAGLNHAKTSRLLYGFELLLLLLAFFLTNTTGVSLVMVVMVALFHILTSILRINQGVEKWLAVIKKMERGEKI